MDDKTGAPLAPGYRDYEIQPKEDNVMQTGSNGRVSMTVYPDGESKMRQRSAVHQAGSPAAHKICWLYAELDGVRCYVMDNSAEVHVVLTKQDLYP